MAFHFRSNSLPSKSHLEIANIEDHIIRLKSSEEASVSASSLCTYLDSLRNLHEDFNSLLQLPSVQQVLLDGNRASELLDGSLKLVDICGIVHGVICFTKYSVQELQSSLRRNRGIGAYVMTSRKNIEKMIKTSIKNLKSFDQSLIRDNDIKSIAAVLEELQVIGLSVLKSALTIFASKQRT